MNTGNRREALVHLYRIVQTIAAAAALSVFAFMGAVPPALAQAPAEKKWKDGQEEYKLYTAANTDLAGNKAAQAIAGLDAWKAKYAESDYSDLRNLLYVRAYAGAGQQAKAVDTAALLLAKDLAATFNDPASGPSDHVTLLFTTTVAIQQVPNPTADEL